MTLPNNHSMDDCIDQKDILDNYPLENCASNSLYIQAFKDLLKQIQDNQFNFKDQTTEHYQILNEQRMNSHFVHMSRCTVAS